MKSLKFATGRFYDAPQVLDITIQSETIDNLGFTDITATFIDASRDISGKVVTTVFDSNIGKAILDAYDAGLYEIV